MAKAAARLQAEGQCRERRFLDVEHARWPSTQPSVEKEVSTRIAVARSRAMFRTSRWIRSGDATPAARVGARATSASMSRSAAAGRAWRDLAPRPEHLEAAPDIDDAAAQRRVRRPVSPVSGAATACTVQQWRGR
ncbi:MAG: hypothetical protein U1E52_02050 [Geminicoccaceae bacterium]